MESNTNPFHIRKYPVSAFELMTAQCFTDIAQAGNNVIEGPLWDNPDVKKELSHNDLLKVITGIRAPLIQLIDHSKFYTQDEDAKKLRKLMRSKKISHRLIPSIEKGMSKKREAKMEKFIKKMFDFMKCYGEFIQGINKGKSSIRALDYIIRTASTREDFIADIHLQAGLRIEESAHAGIEDNRVSSRAKMDQYLSRRKLSAKEISVIESFEIAKHLETWQEELLDKGIKKKEDSFTIAEISSSRTLRELYMNIIYDFNDSDTSFCKEVKKLLFESQISGKIEVLFDILLIALIILEIKRYVVERCVFAYYYEKLEHYSCIDIYNPVSLDTKTFESVLIEFFTAFEEGEFNIKDSSYDPRFSNEDTDKISRIDFEAINNGDYNDEE